MLDESKSMEVESKTEKTETITTTLTDEQRERIRLNRERALERQRRRKLETEKTHQEETTKRRKVTPNKEDLSKQVDGGGDEADVELEDFEVDASPWVSKKEAMKMYCLPEGTLAVCSYEERANPHHKGWTPMKLYARAEIRRRARDRWGGLQGLVEERKRREEKKFRKDFDKAKDVFS